MSDQPLVSVVIPTHNRCAAIIRLLDALAAQATSHTFEVVVTDDGSTDGTAAALSGYRAPFELHWESTVNAGRAAARNRAIASARGRLLIMLDDDMVPPPGFIDAHVAEHTGDEPRFVMGAAPILARPDAGPFLRYMTTTRNEHYERLSEPGRDLHVRDLYFANASVPRAVIAEVGAFDPRFRGYGGEDVDLALRLRSAGVSFRFSLAALANEAYDRTFRGLAADMEDEGRNAVMLAIDHPEAAAGQQFAEPWPQPWLWKTGRSALLALTRLMPQTSAVLDSLTDALERRRCSRMHLWLRFALEYHYWLGAGPALARARAAGHRLP